MIKGVHEWHHHPQLQEHTQFIPNPVLPPAGISVVAALMRLYLLKKRWRQVPRVNAELQRPHQPSFIAASNVDVDISDVQPAVSHAGEGAIVKLMLLWSAHC